MYYDVTFHTNVDCPMGMWDFPKKVVAIPRIGDYVQASNGRRLKVCSITHSWNDSKPVLEIELTKIEWK